MPRLRGLACFALALASSASAQTTHESRAGHGTVSLSYQYIRSDGFEGTQGEVPTGILDTHALSLDVDWHMTERLTLVAGIPYIRERSKGDFPHDPLALDPPRPDIPNVDTGEWNDDFQDFHLGLRYLLRDGPLSIEPFVIAGVPSTDYPYFGHAAIGRNRDQLDVGSTFVYVPPISDAYYRLDISYVFVEETLGVSVDHINVFAEAGYFFSPRFAGRAFLIYRDGDGLDFPDDFPPPRTDERWLQHDRMVRHNFTNVGIGADWSFDADYRVSVSLMTMARAEQVHKMEYALTIGLSRSF